MKTPEDEAFDDLAKKQGDWGGGFPAKRQMAADKLPEPEITMVWDGWDTCWKQATLSECMNRDEDDRWLGYGEDQLRETVAAAVAHEREQCAKIAENFLAALQRDRISIANAIRARGKA